MRILHLTDRVPGYHKKWGGAEQLCLRISELEKQNNMDVEIAAQPPEFKGMDFPYWPVKTIDQVLPAPIAYFVNAIKGYLNFDPIAFFSVRRILKRYRPDIVHCHNIQVLSLSVIAAVKSLQIPIVFSVYDFWCVCPSGFAWRIKSYETFDGKPCFHQDALACLKCLTTIEQRSKKLYLYFPFVFFRRYLFSIMFRQVDRFVILTQENAKPLTRLGIPSSKIKVAHIPFDDGPEGQPARQNTLLFVGWWYLWKGLHRIVQAMPLIIREVPDAKLFVMGAEAHPVYVRRIKKFIRENNLESHIIILGKIPFNEAKQYIQTTQLLVVPEQWETIAPNILTEGMSYGRTIIASDIGGHRDLIQNGVNGVLARYNSNSDFAEKIIFLLKNPESAKELGRLAQEDARRLFSKANVIRELREIFIDIIQ